MNSRQTLKGHAALSTLAFLPTSLLTTKTNKPQRYYIGLGFAGANVIKQIGLKAINANFTFMNWLPYAVKPYPNIHYIEYEYPKEIRGNDDRNIQCIPLTPEMETTLSEDRFYIVFCGLGRFTGTSLNYDTLKFLGDNNKDYLAICSLPLKCEERKRNTYARSKQLELS